MAANLTLTDEQVAKIKAMKAKAAIVLHYRGNDWSRAQVVLMRPSRSSRALETIIRDLIGTRDGATYFAERVWGVSLR